MEDVIFIKAYVELSEIEFDSLTPDELYDGFRGTWKLSEKRIENLQYAFAIHHGIIKKVYLIDKWHKANTTKYNTKKIDIDNPKLNNRLEFTGKIALEMQSFIGKDVSHYYQKGEANPIKYMNLETLKQELLFSNIIYPDDIADEKNYEEGSKKQIIVNAYERNLKAREECINKFGYLCSVCGFDFVKKYGELGKNFIHVHHIKPLSEIDQTYQVDPYKDLRPVCPNCHAMLHRKVPAFSIEEIQNMIV